jgi:hypothetical protein
MAQSLASAPQSNSAARADLIREAVQQQADFDAALKTLNAEVREFKTKTIKGDLGFKLADWAAVYRVSQLADEDRDTLLETVREGFAALGIGQSVDWVTAAQAMAPQHSNGYAAPDPEARAAGRADGLGGVMDHADRYPTGEPGHADYWLGRADGEAERDRVLSMGDGDDAPAPRRGRGRPRKPQQEAEADAEF